MIFKSEPWKQALLESADALEAICFHDDDEADESGFEFERHLFLSALALRKLIESEKLTNRITDVNIGAKFLPLRHPEKLPNRLNWSDLYRFYDHGSAEATRISIVKIANQLIHSFLLGPVVASEKDPNLIGFLVASDEQAKRGLYEVELSEMTKVMRIVANDHVECAEWRAVDDKFVSIRT